MPAGLELYLDAADLSGEGWLEQRVALIRSFAPSRDFDYVVEGPLRSLDGNFFDVTNDGEANRETLRRLVMLGRAIGARLAVIHCIAPIEVGLSKRTGQNGSLERAVPLLSFYAQLCYEAGLLPTIENIPPVARMREGRYMSSLIGIRPSDLRRAVDAVSGLWITLDLSHAQLYINATSQPQLVGIEVLSDLVERLKESKEVTTLDQFITALEDRIANVHVSNARGLLEEGLPYSEGDADLDAAIRRLAYTSQFLVTETLEANDDHAINMRDAQRRMANLLRAEARECQGVRTRGET